jgi:hypothetical protein
MPTQALRRPTAPHQLRPPPWREPGPSEGDNSGCAVIRTIAQLDGIPIFVFHDVDREGFARDLEFLRQNGYRILTTEEFVSLSQAGRREPAVLLTFDDARRNFWDVAFPVLREFDARATLERGGRGGVPAAGGQRGRGRVLLAARLAAGIGPGASALTRHIRWNAPRSGSRVPGARNLRSRARRSPWSWARKRAISPTRGCWDPIDRCRLR